MVRIKKSRALGLLNLTPLLDVMFLLIIFFLVATRFADEERELEVILPSASEARPMTVEPEIIIVNIDDQGRVMVGGKFVDPTELELLLRQAAANNPVNQTVNIRADKRVPLEHAVDVINICKKVGIYDPVITTEGPGG